MSMERVGGIRAVIASEAARLMYEEEVKQYFTAKRMAAKRILGRLEGGRHVRYRPMDLPSNGEIRDALLTLAEACEGASRRRRLFAMRVRALETMRFLEPFEPRLIGSVSTGHVRKGSDIDIQLFVDREEEVEVFLQKRGVPFERERVSISKGGEIRDYVHYHLHGAGESEEVIELTVYPRMDLRFRPKSSTDGKPIVRVGERALISMLRNEHGDAWPRYEETGVVTEAEATLDDVDDDDEEPPVPEPGEEEDPFQVYEPLAGFEGVG